MAAQQEHVVAGAAAEEQQTEHQQIYQQDVYESDEEFEEPLPLALRRREASDDEEEDSDGRDRVHHHHLMHQGGHETEDDEGAPPLEDEDDDDEEENDVRVGLGDGGGVDEYVVDDEGYEEEEDLDEAGDNGGARVLDEQGGDKDGDGDDKVKDEVKEPKKEPEPFSVPTAGAFYMHDDRFRDNGNARPRRMSGGRKLWEAKDDRNWVHDRFEELNLQDEEQGRRGRGFYRGRGRGRGRGGGRVQERSNRSRMYSDMTAPTYVRRGGGGGRGRGGRQQELAVRRSEDVTDRPRKQAPKPIDSIPSNNFNKKNYNTQSGSVYQDGGNPRRNIVSSSLNSASPPFYPSSAQQDISATVKKDQRGIAAGNASHSVLKVDEQISSPNASSVGNGRNIVSTRGQPQVYAEQSQRTFEKKPMNMPNTKSASKSTHQHTHTRRNTGPVGQAAGGQQAIRNTNHSQAEPVQQRVAQNQGQGSQRATSQSVSQQGTSINQSLSRADSSEDREGTSPPASNNAKSVQRARGNSQVVVRGSYQYNGGQAIVSTSGMPLGDQNFTHTPALLPVMPLGGQHPGLGVPAVGMALPGYVAQPQMGFGNSDMTWVPLFAGAAGALGATYCSPYIAMDGNYYPQPAGQLATPSTAGRDSNSNKPQSSWKSPSRSDMGNDEFGQRQNKPRRYSEMNFGQ